MSTEDEVTGYFRRMAEASELQAKVQQEHLELMKKEYDKRNAMESIHLKRILESHEWVREEHELIMKRSKDG